MDQAHITRMLYGVTTPIKVKYQGFTTHGTGFFYNQLEPKNPNEKGPQWRKVEATWLVTNRHVLLPKLDQVEVVPDAVTFYLRRTTTDGIVWEPINLSTDKLRKRAKLHNDSNVDVAIIRVDDLFTELIQQEMEQKPNAKVSDYIPPSGATSDDLPENAGIPIDVGDDVLIVGYPRGFFDQHTLFPIVKSGIIATPYHLNFGGQPRFLIDAKLFPGSSGSLVITKPTNFKVEDSKIYYSPLKKYAICGVYSGEPYFQRKPVDLGDLEIIRKEGFNVGIVWRAELIVDLISAGTTLGEELNQ